MSIREQLSHQLLPMGKIQVPMHNIITLKECRSALISASVTGKIGVRYFQAPEGESHALAALS